MSAVTIKGLINTTALGRGEEATVERTDSVDRLIAGGFVAVVDDHEDVTLPPLDASDHQDAPEPAEETPAQKAAATRKAARKRAEEAAAAAATEQAAAGTAGETTDSDGEQAGSDGAE